MNNTPTAAIIKESRQVRRAKERKIVRASMTKLERRVYKRLPKKLQRELYKEILNSRNS